VPGRLVGRCGLRPRLPRSARTEPHRREQTTALIPALVIVRVVAALGVFRSLQSSAFKSIQLASTLAAVTRRGRQVVDGVYPDETLEPPVAVAPREVVEGEVLWLGSAATLQAIDVPALLRCAERMDVVIELCVQPVEVIPDRGRVALVHGAAEVGADELLPALRTGIERSFDQDPAMALRVLADIALRALSPALNDPTTAVEALDGIDELLRALVRRDLAVETVKGSDGEPRVLLRLPSWEDYVSVSLDEIIENVRSSPLVRRRVEGLLTELVAIARPATRRHSGPASRRRARPAHEEGRWCVQPCWRGGRRLAGVSHVWLAETCAFDARNSRRCRERLMSLVRTSA
jgi:uncharacterized membrane protein